MKPTRVPQSRVYHLTAEGMHFMVTETLRASRVEKWICDIKQQFLDAAQIKCVGLTASSPTLMRVGSVPPSFNSRWICQANEVSQLLKEFLKDNTIRFCGVDIHNDVRMLRYYKIEIPSVID
jgi:hypothetical protein